MLRVETEIEPSGRPWWRSLWHLRTAKGKLEPRRWLVCRLEQNWVWLRLSLVWRGVGSITEATKCEGDNCSFFVDDCVEPSLKHEFEMVKVGEVAEEDTASEE